MGVATLGMLFNGQVPDQTDWLRGWLFALIGVGLGRVVMSFAQRWARARHLVGKSVLIMGAGVVGAQVARRLESHPEYGLFPIGFLDEDPRSVAEVGGRDVPVLGTIEDLDETIERTGVRHLIVAFSSVADARVSRLIQRCQELGVEVSVVPRMFDTINDRVGYDTVGGLPLLSFSAVDLKGGQRPDGAPHTMPVWGVGSTVRGISARARGVARRRISRPTRGAPCARKTPRRRSSSKALRAASPMRRFRGRRSSPIGRSTAGISTPRNGPVFEVRPRAVFAMPEEQFPSGVTRWRFA